VAQRQHRGPHPSPPRRGPDPGPTRLPRPLAEPGSELGGPFLADPLGRRSAALGADAVPLQHPAGSAFTPVQLEPAGAGGSPTSQPEGDGGGAHPDPQSSPRRSPARVQAGAVQPGPALPARGDGEPDPEVAGGFLHHFLHVTLQRGEGGWPCQRASPKRPPARPRAPMGSPTLGRRGHRAGG